MIPSEKLIGTKGQILCTSIYYKCNNIKEAELMEKLLEKTSYYS